jgi:hypothetical protein
MPFSEHGSLTRRRRSKNSGGRIASAAIGGLIEGANCSVNAFRAPKARKARSDGADKMLMWLNFPRYASNG